MSQQKPFWTQRMTEFFKWLLLITTHRLKRYTVQSFRAINASDLAMYSASRLLRDTSWTSTQQPLNKSAVKTLLVPRPLTLLGTAPTSFRTLSMPGLYAHSRNLVVETNHKYFSLRQALPPCKRVFPFMSESPVCSKHAQLAVSLLSNRLPLITWIFNIFNLMIWTLT